MELKELVGQHIFSGIEQGTTSSQGYFGYRECDYIKFCLDDVNYIAIEDPADGYRSYCNELIIEQSPCKIKIPHAVVYVEMDKDNNNDVLHFIDAENNKKILSIGTARYDDYYPYCVMEWVPENLHCNEYDRNW